MAFSPFANFQKYKKIWMAIILLMTMFTFVLCTGVGQGDLGDRVLRLFGGGGGGEVFSINGRKVQVREFDELKLQRTVASDFMRNLYNISHKKLENLIKDVGKQKESPERASRLVILSALKDDLSKRLARKTMFDGGTRVDDIVDFVLWRDEANRLGISLTPATVQDIAYVMALGPTGRSMGQDLYVHDLNINDIQQAEFNTRQTHYQVREDFIIRALSDEFRVQIAKLSLSGSRAEMYEFNAAVNSRYRRPDGQFYSFFVDRQLQPRFPVTPEQINQFYASKRTEADLGLVPVTLLALGKEIAEPSKEKLEEYFNRYKTKKFNPYTEQPGFEIPATIKAEYVIADPKAEYYKIWAKRQLLLEAVPTIVPDPSSAGFAAISACLTPPVAMEAKMEKEYSDLRNPAKVDAKYVSSSLTDSYVALRLFEPKPADVAGLIGFGMAAESGIAAPLGYWETIKKENEPKFKEILQAEAKRRIPIGATLILSAAMEPNWTPHVLAFWANNLHDYNFVASLPNVMGSPARIRDFWLANSLSPYYPRVGHIEKELRDKLEGRVAATEAQQVMQAVRSSLKRAEVAEGPARLNRFNTELNNLAKKNKIKGPDGKELIAFNRVEMRKERNRYDLETDADLAPFREAFEKHLTAINLAEGRSGTLRQLRPDDFYKLFFEAEAFGVGNAALYTYRSWPPVVSVQKKSFEAGAGEEVARERDLFPTAEKPIVFWMLEKTPARAPANLDEVRGRVIEAWRLEQARNSIIPKLKEVAKGLQEARTPEAVKSALAKAAKYGDKEITLNKVAPLVEFKLKPGEDRPTGEQEKELNLGMRAYELPRALIPYVRDDASKQVLMLVASQEPIKSEWEPLDKLNKELFDARKDKGRLVQVLTNKPRTNFYVATIIDSPAPKTLVFSEAPKMIDLCQEENGQRYIQELTRQLRENANVEVGDKARDQFDTDKSSK